MQQPLKSAVASNSPSLLHLDAIEKASLQRDPYPHLFASGLLTPDSRDALTRDFPDIKKPGFIPSNLVERKGAFDALLKELEGPAFAEIMTQKLGVELRDKPRMITIRKWSAAKDGRIHNDGAAKIVTALIYLNDGCDSEGGGKFRVLRSEKTFDDYTMEVDSVFGNFVTFVRTENSWHGHKPFAGERRVVQITWLRSWEDLERKEKRGRFSFFLKRFRRDAY